QSGGDFHGSRPVRAHRHVQRSAGGGQRLPRKTQTEIYGRINMGRVTGKKAFVTGGAQGLGQASALMLAKEGALVTVADINEKGAKAVAEEINAKYPGQGFAVGLDVTSESQWKEALAF